LKGATNSKKHNWLNCMYAENKKRAVEVYTNLRGDGYVGHQAIYIREYIPLKKLCDPISPWAAPISEEYRFFILDGKILAKGFTGQIIQMILRKK